jgi:murein DD-endopeptidase MepM/ murein hydrolase activator NlpD
MATLTREKMAQGQGYQLQIQYLPGNLYALHDPAARYRLPFASGTSHLVGQSYNGAFTHFGSNRYAVDFNMAPGTPVLVARAGTVVDIKADGVLGCPLPRCERDGNFVRIRHADATLAEYAHLQTNGVAVKVGQVVTAGQVLGYSGATGYASGPHLHFAVKKPSSIQSWESLPVTFITPAGALSRPLEGTSYTAP